MVQFDNSQFSQAANQLAATAARANRIALDNAEHAFSLQLATLEENANAAFAFWGEMIQVRDADGLKAAWPKGVQVARENLERSIGTWQEVMGATLKANESIGQIAKGQFETATAQAQADVEKAAKSATRKARR